MSTASEDHDQLGEWQTLNQPTDWQKIAQTRCHRKVHKLPSVTSNWTVTGKTLYKDFGMPWQLESVHRSHRTRRSAHCYSQREMLVSRLYLEPPVWSSHIISLCWTCTDVLFDRSETQSYSTIANRSGRVLQNWEQPFQYLGANDGFASWLKEPFIWALSRGGVEPNLRCQTTNK